MAGQLWHDTAGSTLGRYARKRVRNVATVTLTRKQLIELVNAQYAKAGLPVPYNPYAWLPSDTFQKLYVDLDLAAAPVLPHSTPRLEEVPTTQHLALHTMEVVIDCNVNQVGRTPNFDYLPRLIVVFGYTKWVSAVQSSHVRALNAMVGDKAAKIMSKEL